MIFEFDKKSSSPAEKAGKVKEAAGGRSAGGTKGAKNLRLTRQRRIILDELRRQRTHPTAEELFLILKKRKAGISLSTVYRNLEWLADCGLIGRLEPGGAQRRYDGEAGPHYHIRCVECGRVDDLPGEALPDLGKGVCKACDYEILGYRLEYLGICPRCRKQGKRKPRKEKG